jgi:hypothetical protein
LPARNIRSLKIGPVRVADQETALRRRGAKQHARALFGVTELPA